MVVVAPSRPLESFDFVDVLPDQVAAHAEHLVALLQRHAAIFEATSEKRDDAAKALFYANKECEEMRAELKARPALAADIEKCERRIGRLEREYDRLAARGNTAAAARGSLQSILQGIRDRSNVLATRPLAPKEEYEPPQLQSGQSLSGALAVIRSAIDAVRDRIADVASAPLPSGIVKEAIRLEVDKLAARGRPDVLPAIETGAGIQWPEPVSRPARVFNGEGGHVNVRNHDPIALVCWANREAVVSALFAQVDELANDEAALGPDEREVETERLEAELLALGRREEAIVRAAEAEGIEVCRRDDADVYAVLGVVPGE